MKNALILMMTIFASIGIAKAGSVIIGGFGTDGSSQGMPSANSTEQAAIVYDAISHLDDDGEATIKTDKAEFTCDKPYTTTSGIDLMCSIMMAEGGTLSTDNSYVIIEGLLATMIYAELNTTPIVGTGATTKKVANLTCSKANDGNHTIKCVLTDVMAQEMIIPDDEMGL